MRICAVTQRVDRIPQRGEVRDALDQRLGVCQDFAHIMIAGLRGLGLPAAYVSGYLRTTPPPGRPRLEGADATHAWVSCYSHTIPHEPDRKIAP